MMNKMSIIAITAVLLASACKTKVAQDGASGTADKDVAKSTFAFPTQTSFTKAYLQENFWKCNYRSAGDSLAYWVILPNDVKPVQLNPVLVGGEKLFNIGQYQRVTGSPYLEVWVFTEHCTNAIEPAGWLRALLVAAGETLVEQREVEGASGKKYLDALTLKQISESESVLSRVMVYQSGQSYFAVKVACSHNDYEQLAPTMFHIASNWGTL